MKHYRPFSPQLIHNGRLIRLGKLSLLKYFKASYKLLQLYHTGLGQRGWHICIVQPLDVILQLEIRRLQARTAQMYVLIQNIWCAGYVNEGRFGKNLIYDS